MQVRVWDLGLYSTFEAAAENITGAQYGKSEVFSYTHMPCPAPNCELMINFRGFVLVTNSPPKVLAIRENAERVDIIFEGAHTIQGAPTLGGPWTTLMTGFGPYTDPDSGTLIQRFYRIQDDPGPTYSENAVGYCRINLCQGFSLIAGQLWDGGGNQVTNVLRGALPSTYVFKFNHQTDVYTSLAYIDGAWEGSHLDMTLNPGEGVFVRVPAPFAVRFLGEVRRTSAVQIPEGWSILSVPLPEPGPLSLLPPDGSGFPVRNGDRVFQWRCTSKIYRLNQFIDGIWEGDDNGAPPFMALGEAFFLFRQAEGENWSRTFSVGP